jgi:hypothetical protein
LKSVISVMFLALPMLAQSAKPADKPVDPKDAQIASLQAQLTASQAAAELWQARASAQANACFDVTVARALVKAVDAENVAQIAKQKADAKEPVKK